MIQVAVIVELIKAGSGLLITQPSHSHERRRKRELTPLGLIVVISLACGASAYYGARSSAGDVQKMIAEASSSLERKFDRRFGRLEIILMSHGAQTELPADYTETKDGGPVMSAVATAR